MGKFNIQAMRFLDVQHFRVLTAIEMGMKNHELVPLPLVSSISAFHRGATARTLSDLTRSSLVAYERGKNFDGYRLTTLGYDFLALRALYARGVVGSVGNQIGVGKESDIYVGGDPELKDVVLKLHRLGRTSFRKLKEKRDYHRRRRFCSWLYLSRLAAAKEFAFLRALHSHKFPVPTPIDCCRHIAVMSLITGPTLANITELCDPAALYDRLMKLIVRLGSYGLIHSDFNEFNIMLNEDETPILIDFPQMVSTDHSNADFYFDRDVQCVRTFFKRRFKFESDEWPRFGDVVRRHNLDVELEASGFTRKMRRDLNKAYDEGNFEAHLDEDSEEETDGNGSVEDETEGQGQFDEERQHEGECQLRRCDRFQKWLDEARDELEALEFREGKLDGEQLVEVLETLEEKTEEALDEAKVEKDSEKKADDQQNDGGEEEVTYTGPLPNSPQKTAPNLAWEEYQERNFSKAFSVLHQETKNTDRSGNQRGETEAVTKRRPATGPPRTTVVGSSSVVSGGSTVITPEEVRRRLMMEKRKVRKEKLKVKGQQNAVRRGRQQNQELIKEYAGWDEY